MKTLLSTTALVVALGFPVLTLAQTTAPPANPGAQQQDGEMSEFLAERGQSDVFASDLMGHDVHARRTPVDTTASETGATMNADGTHGMAMMTRADMEDMENIGQINEIVLSPDGQVRAVVIGVGGFLGVAEQDVAVTMDEVTFASDAEDRSQMYIVVNIAADRLSDAPTYDRMAARTDTAQGDDDATAGRSMLAAPNLEREGYERLEVSEVSTEVLMGKTVYDMNDNDVGSVTDMIIDDSGDLTNVIIDFGGFLGIGSSQASLDFEELTILTNEGNEDVRLYVDATKEQIEDLPQYEGMN